MKPSQNRTNGNKRQSQPSELTIETGIAEKEELEEEEVVVGDKEQPVVANVETTFEKQGVTNDVDSDDPVNTDELM